MSGKAAAFGARMIDSVADQILKQFAANFAAQVQALPEAVAAASAPPAGERFRQHGGAARGTGTEPLNGIALLWAAVRGWLRSVCAAKKA